MSTSPRRRAVVTGAGRGIGAGIATELADAGLDVVAIDRDASSLETAWADDPRVHPFVLDLSDPTDLAEGWERLVELHGPVDVLVNNAAVTHLKSLWEITVDEWDEVVAVNQRAVFLLSRLAGRAMADRGWGRIVNISSLAGQAARPSGAHYAATKAAGLALTRVFAAELAGAGVTVNAVAPGTIESAMTAALSAARLDQLRDQIPVGRLGQATDIAAAVVFLVSEGASFVTGATIDANGGVLMR
ncbi:SDR family NAD(P)-dependent oxidoreductase [Herbiconiux sp. P15]|uniref:SDR family NAD(P)-dependent oxidoreductase n=1 Tax=Herbiconiux liukaitaii TaxID=3342799 RepID=UPI0035B75C4D